MGACKGPPGTGKTKTILGLLGIVLYAAPEGSSGLVIHEDVALAPLTPTQRTQLWHAASPWACGAPNPRLENPNMMMTSLSLCLPGDVTNRIGSLRRVQPR